MIAVCGLLKKQSLTMIGRRYRRIKREDYYLSGKDYSGKEWRLEIGEGTYNKYYGKSFNGTVRLEVWQNLNKIEKIISVEPSSNEQQEPTEWKSTYDSIFNQQEKS